MSSTVLVGTQWGDEGKGKICDLIASDFDCVVRYQGGNNAGHTIVVGDKKYGLHQVPSGIMYPQCISVIGNGCVVNPAVLLEEIDMFEADGISTANLKVSGNAHVIMPYHIDLDGALRGAARQPQHRHHQARHRPVLPGQNGAHRYPHAGPALGGGLPREGRPRARPRKPATRAHLPPAHLHVDQICESYLPMAERLRPYIAETAQLLGDLAADGKKILFEGAQATLLDIDHGTYPFVTSSNCTAGGAVTGSGVGMNRYTYSTACSAS